MAGSACTQAPQLRRCKHNSRAFTLPPSLYPIGRTWLMPFVSVHLFYHILQSRSWPEAIASTSFSLSVPEKKGELTQFLVVVVEGGDSSLAVTLSEHSSVDWLYPYLWTDFCKQSPSLLKVACQHHLDNR